MENLHQLNYHYIMQDHSVGMDEETESESEA